MSSDARSRFLPALWAGLYDRVTVVSPHLDDAVLSVGSWIAAISEAGCSVRVLTVFGNDDATDDQPLGEWDRVCGFGSARAAARARRHEDLRACELLGAESVCLPFGDDEHIREPDGAVRRALRENLGGANAVLSPGFPLTHPDHRRVAACMERLDEGAHYRRFVYREQPYATAVALGRARRGGSTNSVGTAGLALARSVAAFHWGGAGLGWRRREKEPLPPGLGATWGAVKTSRRHWLAKQRAVGAYSSQVRAIGVVPLMAAALYDAGHGGEAIGATRRELAV